MDGIDLAWEVKQPWPLLPVILTSGHPRECVREFPPGVQYMPKPWQPLIVLIAAEQALSVCALTGRIGPLTGTTDRAVLFPERHLSICAPL
jgi:hypothetical protein